jgi:DNA-binding beta-propeller fold protein YncE
MMICVLATAAASCGWAEDPIDPEPFDVWVVDQSDSPGLTHGGTVYVYDGAGLNAKAAAGAEPKLRIDLGDATSALCQTRTGAMPVRPHMIRFNEAQTHAIIPFVASGHIVFLDADTGAPVECLRATRSATGQQAHAAYPSPDGRYVLVANQNGKRLERIEASYASNTFTHDSAAMLDLATCTTPTGARCEDSSIRPDNAPVCPFISEGGLAFVTLRGGGLLVVDIRDTPMRIVAEYDARIVKGNGCGGVEVDGQMYLNAGGRPGIHDHMELYGFEVYRFPLSEFDDRLGAIPINTPTVATLWSSEGAHDSHGMVATPDGRYLWVMDRHGDVAEVFETADGAHVATILLNGELTDNAAPDIAAISPAGERIFVALRGAIPLSGDPHNATGSTPGLGIIELSEGGRVGRLAAIVRLTNIHDGTDRADPHSVAVRLLR